jgi:excisionase family DNA binding protein
VGGSVTGGRSQRARKAVQSTAEGDRLRRSSHEGVASVPDALAGSGRLGSVTAMASILPRTAATLAAQKRSAPALALSVEQACEALGVSWDTWRAHIEPEVPLVRLGRRKLIPVSELQAWLDRHAESVGVGE